MNQQQLRAKLWKNISPLPFYLVWLLFSFGYSSHISQHAEYISLSSTIIEPSWTREILSSESVSQVKKPSDAVKKQPSEAKITYNEDVNSDQNVKEVVNKNVNEQNVNKKENIVNNAEKEQKDHPEKDLSKSDSENGKTEPLNEKVLSHSGSPPDTTEDSKAKETVQDSSRSTGKDKENGGDKIGATDPQNGKVHTEQETKTSSSKENNIEVEKPSQVPKEEDDSSLPPPSEPASSPSDPVNEPHGSEFIPSFDEWKKMMLAEQEKEGGQRVSSVVSGKKVTSHKRRRNYASYECGAKVVAANPEAESRSRILNEMMDEYMLNPCKAKIWFVIELCDSIQATQLELANFELFSSSPKEFTVYWSEHFPSRDWTSLGTFVAQDIRTLQSFNLPQGGFGKFIKIELHGYYGSEHYCPLSIVRVFGTSMVDEYEALETSEVMHQISEDDEDRLDMPIEDTTRPARNLFGSARDAVINIVKKATEALTGDREKQDEVVEDTKKGQKASIIDSSWMPPVQEISSSVTNRNKSEKNESEKQSLCSNQPKNSLVKLLSPYIRRCRFCSSLPATDRHHTYAEPTQLCRFLEATLGPPVFQAVCMEYHRQIHLISHRGGIVEPEPGCLDMQKLSTTVEEKQRISMATTDSLAEKMKAHSIEPSFTKEPIQHTQFSGDPMIAMTDSFASGDSRTGVDIPTPPLTGSMITSEILQTSDVGTSAQSGDANLLSISETPPLPKFTPAATEPLAPGDSKVGFPGSRSSAGSLPTSHTESLSTYISAAVGEEQVPSPTDGIPVTEIPIAVPEMDTVTLTPSQSSEMPSPTVKDSHHGAKAVQHEDKRVQSDGQMDSIMVPVAGQKESVFMRLSNRIRYLELNMSLSSQYLEELSQRYRRQMEEMQRAFNRTVGKLNDTARKAAERDIRQQEAIGHLQSQLSNLTAAVNELMHQRDSMHKQMLETHLCLMAVEAIVMITILSLCVRRMASQSQMRASATASSSSLVPSASVNHTTPLKRHNSVGVISTPSGNVVPKKRRYSDDILTGSSPHLMIVEPSIPILVDPPPRAKKKQKNKKNRGNQGHMNQQHRQHPHKSSSLSQLNKVCQSEVTVMPSHKEAQQDVRWKQLERMHSSPAGVLFSHTSSSNKSLSPSEETQSSEVQEQQAQQDQASVRSFSEDVKITSSTDVAVARAPVKKAASEKTSGKRSMSLVPLSGHQKVKTREKTPVQIFSLKKLLRLEKRQSV